MKSTRGNTWTITYGASYPYDLYIAPYTAGISNEKQTYARVIYMIGKIKFLKFLNSLLLALNPLTTIKIALKAT